MIFSGVTSIYGFVRVYFETLYHSVLYTFEQLCQASISLGIFVIPLYPNFFRVIAIHGGFFLPGVFYEGLMDIFCEFGLVVFGFFSFNFRDMS